MDSHPVPQNITGFEFKLIGFLTLRQFGYLAAAAIFIFILYSARLPFLVVVGIGIPVAAFGIALAFARFNNMPFERWIAAFFKTVYSPNVRVWHREPKEIGFLEPQFASYLHRQSEAVEPHVYSDPTKLKLYLQSHKRAKAKNQVDIKEERALEALNLSNFVADKQVFKAPKLDIQEGNFENQGVTLKRMPEVVEQAQARSEGEVA